MYSTPTVSIYCTVRNGSRHLPEMLSSLVSQTIADWELIVVDDGSTDETLSILRSYAAIDRRVSLIVTGGVGRGTALNLGVRECRGEFVANIDADDFAARALLESCLAAFRIAPQIDLIAGQCLLFQSAPPVALQTEQGSALLPVADVTNRLPFGNPIMHSGIVARRSAILAVGGYDETRLAQFDYDLWVRMAARGSRLAVLKLPLAGKRVHDAQSFEARNRIIYVLRSAVVQYRAARLLGAPSSAYAAVAAKVAWAFVPRVIQLKIRRVFFRREVGRTFEET